MAAVCGRYCGACEAVASGACCGCGYQLGRSPHGQCLIFECCASERGLEHCGLCLDFPCQVFVSHTRPPDVARLVKALYHRVEVGTAAWLLEQD
jgi:hypothetical protein